MLGKSALVTSPVVVAFRSSRSGQCLDHAVMSSGGFTCPCSWAVVVVTRAMDCSEK